MGFIVWPAAAPYKHYIILSKEVKGTVKKTFARFLSLLLVVAMLMPSALAAPDPVGGGVGSSQAGSGGSNPKSPFSTNTNSSTYGAGLMISVESPDGVQLSYVDDPSNPENPRKIDPEDKKDFYEYYTDHFPKTSPDDNEYGMYLIPTNYYDKHGGRSQSYIRGAPGNTKNIVGFDLGDQQMRMQTPSPQVDNKGGKAAWNLAYQNMKSNPARPSPHLDPGYWINYVNNLSRSEAETRIAQIFSSSNTAAGYNSASAASELPNRVYAYLGFDGGLNSFPELGWKNPYYGTAMFMNYCSFLADAIKCMPAEKQTTLAKQLENMSQTFLNGDPWQPMVVVSEVIVPSICWTNELRFWWAPRQSISTLMKQRIPVEVNPSTTTGGVVGQLLGTGYDSAAGGLNMYGNPKDAPNWTPYKLSGGGQIPIFGTLFKSVEESLLTSVGSSYKPIEGFAVWGMSAEYVPNPPPPQTSDAGPVPQGTISIQAEPPQIVKEPGGYSDNADLRVTVSLSAEYHESLEDVANNIFYENQGVGLSNTLDWLYLMRLKGHSFDNPKIEIWVSQHKELDAISADAANGLIDRTMGYDGDGNEIRPNIYGDLVSSNQEAAAVGIGDWTQLNLAQYASFKDPGIQGVNVSMTSAGSILLEFTDLKAARDYFRTNGDTLTFDLSVPINGTLETEDSRDQHWFIVGGRVTMSGPKSLLEMDTMSQVTTRLNCMPKFAYVTVVAKPEEKPYYYSTYQDPYSEFKQGTVPVSGGGSDEKFNSMTGTPTFTDTSIRTDFEGTPYENAGHYYQYFASGGSEFVVQFDGEYHYNESATRTFTFNFSGVNCDQSTGSYKCPGHPQKDGPPSYCDDSCVHAVHCKNHPHVLSSSCSFSVTYNGLSYVEITNLKVWKLSEARLDGTRELLDTKEVYAEVKSTAPGISYNIAASNTAEQGRMVYEWMPKGTGEGGDRDNLVWNRTSSSSCSGAAEENKAVVEGILSSATAGAVMLSDYIVLHTTNGDQSILYFETESDSTGVPLMSAISTSSHSPTFGSDNATITVTVTPSVADGVEFPELKDKDTETLQNLLWKNNPYTSEGCALPEDGITYGGYNGNYSSMNTKYKSSGHPANMTSWSSTAAYKNISGVFGQKSNSELYKATVTKKFRLLNDELVIPDNKQNGEYILGNSEIFYENIVDFSNTQANYPIVRQSKYDGKEGFVLATTYSPSHDKINDIVVYNPVSNQNAIVVSLPKDRDQRVSTHIVPSVDKNVGCPGDASCPYLKNVCTVTEHIHTESCYEQVSYEVHGPNNVHVHDENCGGSHQWKAGWCTSCQDFTTGCDDGYKCLICGAYYDYGDTPPSTSCTGGGWYVTHGSGCSYAGETHFTTSKSKCTTCGHSCGGTYTSAYTCNNLPLNAHQCNPNQGGGGQNQQQYETISRRVSYAASGTDVHTFTAWDSGTVRFRSTWNNKDPRGRVYVNGSQKVDNDDGAGSLNFDTGTVRFNKGDSIRLNIYQYGNRGAGDCDIVIEIRYDNPPVVIPVVQCYTMYKSVMSCSDPHHAYSYNWRIYTYGLKHTSGKVCSGRGCTDTTNLIFPTQEEYSLAECAAGYIVRHSNGDVHLSTEQGVCTYCGQTYKELLSSAQDTDRTPDPSEYECYPYGDTRCWAPCGDNSKHQTYVTEITDNGTSYQMGDFINLDWPFTIYFPNTGDFYGTGAKWSSTTSAERGHGYTDGMDATEWTKCKWVEFPFAVVYNDTTYLANERIYLEVPKTVFEFYVPLHDSEIASAEVKFGSVAINTQNGEELECGANANHNISNITYNGKPKAHHHNADKRTYIDVVGRIGNLALNDTGDFRYSNLFKQPLSEWLVQNIVKKVDPTKQNYIMLDGVDVRKVPITSTGVAGNTHNTRPERGNVNKVLNFPLTPAKNNITALQRQPIRVGYDSYFDLTTLGNYYGNTIYDAEGATVGSNLVLIKPHYYRLDLDTGNYEPVDVYMDVNGNYVLINDNDSNTVAYSGTDANVNLNWVEEKDRRNYSGSEVTNSNLVADANSWIELPRGSSWVYGNYNILNLTQRNRTFVGSEYTYNDKDDWNSHKDPSDRLPNTLAALQGQRWHFNVGLPSSAVFVYSGQEASEANIKACTSGNAVIFCALEIYSQGEVWTLAYDGSNVNVPFKVTPDGKTYDPYVPYPDPDKNPKGEEMPIVSIISINHSSKEDMDVIGTQ